MLTSRIPQVKFAEPGPDVLRLVLDVLCTWRSRARERRQLAALDARELRDIAVSRYDRRIECAKPFWRG
jgi:uncharacterized protein YjiS (DUF1127 family)